MIRTKGEAGTGDVNQAVTHQRNIQRSIGKLEGMPTRNATNGPANTKHLG